jgi:hypothetical protein
MDPQVLQRARADVQSTLSLVPHFATMSSADQFDLYRQLVTARSDQLAKQADPNPARSQAMLIPGVGNVVGGVGGLLGGGGGGGGPLGGGGGTARRASELIDDSRHANRRIDQLGDIASDFIDAVSFPTFVSDLLEGVFRANLNVTKEQMVAYQELLKAATQSLAFFMKKIPPQESFAYLAANNDDDFSVSFPPDDGPAELMDKEGNVVARAGEEPEDATVKAKIMDATLAMAKEQRAMLREIMLMGVTRLVVEKGIIRASVKFDFKATEKIDRKDKAMVQDATSTSNSISHSGGFFGSIFGGPQGGYTRSNRHAELSVATTQSTGDTTVSANLTGFVEIQFKSDYFRLDNFATMYGPTQPGALVPPTGAPGAAAMAPQLPPPQGPG